MNSDRLARCYETLTPWERLPLIMDACAREDSVEEGRLVRSAPQRFFGVPDYWTLAEGLDELAKLYLLEQLDLTVAYWRLTGHLEREPLFRPCQQERQRDKRRWRVVRMLAYRLVVFADGWRLLCAEMHVDPEVLLRELTGYPAVQQTEEAARSLAFNAEQALAYVRANVETGQTAEGLEPAAQREYRLDTAADVAESMRAFLQARLQRGTDCGGGVR